MSYEKMFNEFFLNITSQLYGADPFAFVRLDDADKQLRQTFADTQASIHEALCDSIDTVCMYLCVCVCVCVPVCPCLYLCLCLCLCCVFSVLLAMLNLVLFAGDVLWL